MSMAVEINLRHIYYVPNYSEEDYISKVTVSATGALNFKRLWTVFQNIGRKMTCADFIENLSELNDGENFPKEVLKSIFQSIKTEAIEWAV